MSKKLAKGAIVLITSFVFSWIGAALDHGNWFGWTSNVLGLLGMAAGYILARMLDGYVAS